LNYRHAYHAGNFADVFKHIVLVSLIQSLLRKETAFCYLETHAGIGRYDLRSSASQKKKEFVDGIGKIIAEKNPPELIQDYLACIKKLNQTDGVKLNKIDKLQYYPGSPYIAQCFLRPQDRMVLSELHPDDYQTLKNVFKHDKQIGIHHQDGYQTLKAFLPPKERRGLVLIDPPYENPGELNSLPNILSNAIDRWETGIYALWYPIKTRLQLTHFYRELKAKISRPMLTLELLVYSEDIAVQLNGCGMVIINPPWQLDQQFEVMMPWLRKTLRVNADV